MNNEMLELAKELKANALLTRRYQIAKCSVWSDQLINLCEHVEKTSQANEDSTKLIEAFCADDAEWHKLLDAREQENLTLISLVVKLADKYSEMQKELERINNLQPVLFTIEDGSGCLHFNRVTKTNGEELSHQLNILQRNKPEQQFNIAKLYRLDK
ncbi:hypothetical protein [Providencia sp. PROV273]|uniref:hypothetical protein n=1 Tax=Providencia sp. PROV273 TaxID=2949960 RepID=UPI00234A7F40|nr:hypothetical protein [Providencia sp. PROV273]